MVAFSMFDSRRVALFLDEEQREPGLRGRKGIVAVVIVDVGEPVVVFLDHIRGDEMRKEEATSARR